MASPRAATPAAKSRPSRFDIGDRVVHPRYGAGEVVAHGRRRVLGSARDYLEIEMAHGSLRILVPCDATAAVGLRAIAGPRALRRIVEVLENEPAPIKESSSARQRRNLARLKGGDVLELSAVIRDLVLRAADGKLSPTERRLLERSRAVLASELRYALGVGVEQADAYIDERVARADCRCGPVGDEPA
jgi:CarD family transcriptional regulator